MAGYPEWTDVMRCELEYNNNSGEAGAVET